MGHVKAHEFTPTYPTLKQSYLPGILYVTMTLFNKRENVEYYELGVFDENWEAVPFVSMGNPIIKIEYLQKREINIYITEKNKERAKYVCSKSKLVVDGTAKTSVSSRICSKIQ